MTAFRVLVALVALFFVGVPLLLPLGYALAEPSAGRGWLEGDRLARLLLTTASLAGLVWLLAVPLGAVVGFLLYRSDLPGRVWARGLLLLALFVPLPILATAWQAVSQRGTWGMWAQGLWPAAAIHALAALPWVVLLVGLGCRLVERELEEDALTSGPWPWVVWWVTLPRAGAALLGASVWVVVQTTTEITITDLFQVRTFAEEVYTQMVAPEPGPGDAVRRATLTCLPPLLLLALLVGVALRSILGSLPGRERLLQEPLLVPLGRWRWSAALFVHALALVLLGVPLVALLVRAGTPSGGTWSLAYLGEQLRLIGQTEARQLGASLGVAVVTGLLATSLALALCLAARGSVRFGTFTVVLALLAWTMPGPLVGQGYRDLVQLVLPPLGWPEPLARWLWDGPSPVPLLAVDVVRLLPYALALLWPAVHAIPRSLTETATLDGLRPLAQLRVVLLPLLGRAVLASVVAVGILTLGELAASKRVSTPDMPAYAETIFVQMHYGVTADLAARCLVLLAVVLGAGLLLRRAQPIS